MVWIVSTLNLKCMLMTPSPSSKIQMQLTWESWFSGKWFKWSWKGNDCLRLTEVYPCSTESWLFLWKSIPPHSRIKQTIPSFKPSIAGWKNISLYHWISISVRLRKGTPCSITEQRQKDVLSNRHLRWYSILGDLEYFTNLQISSVVILGPTFP